ncbi:MAG: tetratricopeptide repeat protein [Cyanobacteria bacterium J06632_3]
MQAASARSHNAAAGGHISLSMPRAEVVSTLNKTLQQSVPSHINTEQGRSSRAEAAKQGSSQAHSHPSEAASEQAPEYSDHPDLIQSLADSAYLCECQGRLGEAERLYKQSLMLSERRYGPHHLDTAPRLSELAAFYVAQLRYEAAEPLLQQLVQVRSQYQPAKHIDVAQARYQLAQLYYAQQRYTAAEPLLQKVLATFTDELGGQHPQTQAAHALMVETLAAAIQARQSGKSTAPIPALDLERISELYSWAHPHWMTPTADNTYSWVLTGWGQISDAQELES